MAASCWRSSAPTRRASTLHPVAPLYSTLLQIDPYSYPNVIGDAASEWTISPDGLTYTFKIRQGIRFHDGSTLTAADVKATYDKIVFPPDVVRSPRKIHYTAVAGIEAPYPSIVVSGGRATSSTPSIASSAVCIPYSSRCS